MDNDLFKAAAKVREHAHAPYSHFPVGAALRTVSGAIHVGCNAENGAFPEGWCAETAAIATMISASTSGDDRRIAEILVMAEPINGRLTSPCGGCRQRIAEFGNADTIVHLVNPGGTESTTFRLGELLPDAFAAHDR